MGKVRVKRVFVAEYEYEGGPEEAHYEENLKGGELDEYVTVVVGFEDMKLTQIAAEVHLDSV